MSRLDEKRFNALGQEWIARFDFNATCAIEDETGESFYDVAAPFLEQLDKAEATNPAAALKLLGRRYNSRIRLILFHALSEHSQGIVTEKKAGEIISDIGLAKATELVLWAIAKGLDADVDGEAEGNAPPAAPTPNRKARKAAAARG